MSKFNLKGRVALVTGASSGLGIRFAKVLAEGGADVAIVARRYDRLVNLAAEIEKLGVNCLPLKCDATDEQSVIDCVSQVIARFGRLDILVNNAGVANGGNAEEMKGDDFRWVMDVNVNAVFYFAREAAKNMIDNKYGRIINIASMYGQVGNKFSYTAAYHASKGAVINLTRALAMEWAKHNITVNAIGPGFYESEMTDGLFKHQQFVDFVKTMTAFERQGKPEELDTALLFLAANGSTYITGQTIFVDGGWTAL